MNFAELVRILKMRGGFDVVNHAITKNQIRVLGRVPKDMMNAWLVIIHHMLSHSEAAAWSVDISKQYFLRNGRVLFGWRLIIQGDDIEQHLPSICEALSNTPRPKVIVEEQKLYGASSNRNAPRGGKGAQGVLTAVVGPMAVAQQMAGGR